MITNVVRWSTGIPSGTVTSVRVLPFHKWTLTALPDSWPLVRSRVSTQGVNSRDPAPHVSPGQSSMAPRLYLLPVGKLLGDTDLWIINGAITIETKSDTIMFRSFICNLIRYF